MAGLESAHSPKISPNLAQHFYNNIMKLGFRPYKAVLNKLADL
jgi:hypothetical protein